MRVIVGVDPGKRGGIVALTEKREVVFKKAMPECILSFAEILRGLNQTYEMTIAIEKSQAMRGNGIVSTWNYGFHNGELSAALKFLNIPYHLVAPQTWTRKMHANCPDLPSKERSKLIVKALFPNEDLRDPDTKRARTIHPGLMDALLIAEYTRAKLL